MRYTELAKTLVRDIAEGAHPVGSQLPSEVALASRYDVSRSTVRAALDIVEGLGLISRKRRVGTIVERTEPSNTYTKSLHTIEDLIQYAARTERTVMGMDGIICDIRLADTLECKPGRRWLRVQMLRTEMDAPQTPVCWTDAYIEPGVGESIASRIEGGAGLLCHVIERVTGRAVFDIKQQIGATRIDAAMARLLSTAADSPGLEITRQYRDKSGDAFLVTVSVYPPEKFKYTFWLQRSAA